MTEKRQDCGDVQKWNRDAELERAAPEKLSRRLELRDEGRLIKLARSMRDEEPDEDAELGSFSSMLKPDNLLLALSNEAELGVVGGKG